MRAKYSSKKSAKNPGRCHSSMKHFCAMGFAGLLVFSFKILNHLKAENLHQILGPMCTFNKGKLSIGAKVLTGQTDKHMARHKITKR